MGWATHKVIYILEYIPFPILDPLDPQGLCKTKRGYPESPEGRALSKCVAVLALPSSPVYYASVLTYLLMWSEILSALLLAILLGGA